ncbi:cytochrome c5 family protein [Aquisalimonas sp. 2447]|uniref:c-type cytochrome n=1 Tax=Aquisalimonas sp. 2447 TaxID=2740807 RepID=UPI00143273C2|nr:c-type cytochrome [Aquisalimonas sp. 2447]QIT56951.1 cytochrome c5 family protein [Aquisalimonas sp. 2447]
MSSEQDDKAFMRSFGGVMVLLTVAAFIIAGLAVFAATFETSRDMARAEHERERISQRLQPHGVVRENGDADPMAMAEEEADDADDDAEEVAMSGSEVNESACMACHASGVMDSPVTGDNDAWASLYEDKGLEELVYNAINGIRGMPARGGDSSLSDEEVRRAVVYILEESDVELDDDELADVEEEF